MPPVSDPNYFVRRAESGPERDNPLAPAPPQDAPSPRVPSGVMVSGAAVHQAIQYRYYTEAMRREYVSAVTNRYPEVRNPWHYQFAPESDYVPINTLHEKIAIACANDTDFEGRWANRSENDRNHYRGIATRVLQIIPVPGAKEES